MIHYELGRLDGELRAAHALLCDPDVPPRHQEEAGRLLERVDEALGALARDAPSTDTAKRLLQLRSTLSGHLLAAVTLDQAVPPPSSAAVETLRRAAEKTLAGLQELTVSTRTADVIFAK